MNGLVYFKLEHSQFWSNIEFDRNTVSRTAPGCIFSGRHYGTMSIDFQDFVNVFTSEFYVICQFMGTKKTQRINVFFERKQIYILSMFYLKKPVEV